MYTTKKYIKSWEFSKIIILKSKNSHKRDEKRNIIQARVIDVKLVDCESAMQWTFKLTFYKSDVRFEQTSRLT